MRWVDLPAGGIGSEPLVAASRSVEPVALPVMASRLFLGNACRSLGTPFWPAVVSKSCIPYAICLQVS